MTVRVLKGLIKKYKHVFVFLIETKQKKWKNGKAQNKLKVFNLVIMLRLLINQVVSLFGG